uniref:TIL domain-containing protein n=1 Tax=Strongyloides papillosus TaxID=174720 RepID=A0A0N5BQ16_STREA
MIFKLHYPLFILFLVAFIEGAEKKPKCGANMVAKKCRACSNTCSFTRSLPPKPLKKCYEKKDCEKNKYYACVCKKGYYLNDKDKCVRKDKCYSKPKTTKKPTTTTGKCPKNEIWASCRSACEPNCLDNIKEPKPCPRICKPAGCQCKKDFVRDDSTNTCVKRKQCTKTSTLFPETTPSCPKNEHFDECGTACPITCNNYYNQPKVCTMQCVIGCVCNEGYIRDKQTNQCVLPIHCSRNTTYECPENEHFDECSTDCPITCSNHKNPPKVCNKMCRVGCVCDRDYVRDEASDKCVKRSECPTRTTVEPETTPVCPANMVYTNCKSAC